MAECFGCGDKVKHQWEHVECAVKSTVEEHKGTSLYNMVKKQYPNLVKKYELEESICLELQRQ